MLLCCSDELPESEDLAQRTIGDFSQQSDSADDLTEDDAFDGQPVDVPTEIADDIPAAELDSDVGAELNTDPVEDGTDSVSELDGYGDLDLDSSEDDAPIDEPCGNGIVEPPEACDDGDEVDDDGCNRDCALTGVDEVFAQIRNIPPAATRLALVLDGGGLSGPSTVVHDITERPVTHVNLSAPSGGPYRLRVMAIGGEWINGIFAGSVQDGLMVSSGGSIGVVVTLERVTVEMHTDTPSEVVVAQTFPIRLQITDPSHALEDATTGNLMVSTTPFSDTMTAANPATLTFVGGDVWEYSTNMTIDNPNLSRTLYLQFSASVYGLPSSEAWYVIAPSSLAADALLTINVLQSLSGLTIRVQDAPVGADRAFVSIDGPTDQLFPFTDGFELVDGTESIQMGLLGGETYRVRAVAGEGDVSAYFIAAGGLLETVVVPESDFLEVSVPLSEYGYVVDGATPATIPYDEPFTIEVSVTDPADTLGFPGGCVIYWANEAFVVDQTGAGTPGTTIRESLGDYTLTFDLPAQTVEGHVFFQAGGSSSGFCGASHCPYLRFPTLFFGETLESIPIAPP